MTLLEVMEQGGGGKKALGRHAVAALLNASSANVNYLYSVGEVITIVQNAFASGNFRAAKNMLAEQNADETVCPIN
jgi:hypothetical protein